MSQSPYTENYVNHYLNIKGVYPSVFALKMFLGKNPDLDLRDEDFSGKSILDVGFGDGRDLVLFHSLGFDVFGVEVDRQVVEHTQRKLDTIGLKTKLTIGYNDETGFGRNSLDYVYSCAALMYLRSYESSIHKTLSHVYDILKPGGRIFGTFTRFDSHITNESTKVDQNRIICKDPFYKQRVGQLYWLHNSKNEVKSDLLNAGFSDCKIYIYDVDWFGTRETAFIFAATK